MINPIFSGISVTLPNIKKITLSTLWLSKDKGHGHPNLTISSSRYKFSKISNPTMFWNFLLIFGRIVADKIIFYLKKFDCKISKGLWDILGQTWHEMKVPLSPRLPITAVKICVENIFAYSLWYGKFTIQNTWMVLNVFMEINFDKICAKTTNFV